MKTSIPAGKASKWELFFSSWYGLPISYIVLSGTLVLLIMVVEQIPLSEMTTDMIGFTFGLGFLLGIFFLVGTLVEYTTHIINMSGRMVEDVAAVLTLCVVAAMLGCYAAMLYYRYKKGEIRRILLWIVFGILLLGFTSCGAMIGGGSYGSIS